jgi:hypothetical protein
MKHRRRAMLAANQGEPVAALPASWQEVQRLDDLTAIAGVLGVELVGNRAKDNGTVWGAVKAKS